MSSGAGRRRASTVRSEDLQQALAMSSFDAVQAQMDDRHRWMVTKLKVSTMATDVGRFE